MKAAKEESRPSKKVRKSTYYMKLLKIFLFMLFYTHVCPHWYNVNYNADVFTMYSSISLMFHWAIFFFRWPMRMTMTTMMTLTGRWVPTAPAQRVMEERDRGQRSTQLPCFWKSRSQQLQLDTCWFNSKHVYLFTENYW